MGVLDKLLENIYYEGQKPYTAASSPAPQATTKKPGITAGAEVPSPSEVTQTKPVTDIGATPTTWVPKSSAATALQQQQQVDTQQQLDMEAGAKRLMEKFKSKFPAAKPAPSFWSKLLYPVTKPLTWVEKIDATSYGLVRGLAMSVIKGTSLSKEMNYDLSSKSIWQAAQDYTHSLNTWEQFLGEMVVSPFNLIPFGLVPGGAAKGIGRLSSFLARTQVEGATTWGAKALVTAIGYTPSGLRARVSHRVPEFMDSLLKAEDILHHNALQESSIAARGIIRRFKAFTNGDVTELSTFMRDKDIPTWLNLPETREVQSYFKKAIDKGAVDWKDFTNPMGYGFERTAGQVESDVYFGIQRAVAPMTYKTLGGGLGGTGILTTIGNPAYNSSRWIVRQLTCMLLLTRPAFTAYNQMTNMYMLMERHAMDVVKHVLNPKMSKLAAKEFWGLTNAPVMVREGMGFNYLAAQEALAKGEELLGVVEKAAKSGKTLPLFATGSFGKAVRESRQMYLKASEGQAPFLEKVIPLLRSYDSWIRGVNVASEEYFRSATFYFTHRKTYDLMMKNHLKAMGFTGTIPEALALGKKWMGEAAKPINMTLGVAPEFAPKGYWKSSSVDKGVWRVEGEEPPLRPAKTFSETPEGAYVETPEFIEPTNPTLNEYKIQIKHPLEARDQLHLLFNWSDKGDPIAKEIAGKAISMSHANREADWFIEADTYIAQKTGEMGFDGLIYNAPLGPGGKEYVILDPSLVKPKQWLSPKDLASFDGLTAIDKAALEVKMADLQDEPSIEDLLNVFDNRMSNVGEEAKNLSIFTGLHGDAKSIDGSLDAIFADVGAGTDAELTAKLAENSPQQKAFLAKVNSRDWKRLSKEVDEITAPHTEAEQKLRDSLLQVDSNFRDRVLLIDTRYHLEVENYKKFAKGQKSKVLQSDVQNIYNKLYKEKMQEYDFWYNKKKLILEDLKKVKQDAGGVLTVNDIDTYFTKQTDAINAVLKQHGLDPDVMFGKTPFDAKEIVDNFTNESLNSLQKAKTQTLLNWDNRMRSKFPEYLDASDVQKLHNEARAYAYREGVRTMENDYFNYSTRNTFDWLMSTISPYPFWQTRFVMHFATRCLDNPKQLNAMFILVKKWADSTKELPSFLMASPIGITMPDGGEIRFSPYQFFFPLGYGMTSIEKYSEQANDASDAISQIQDMVGGYLMPQYEISLGLLDNFGIPISKTRGQGLARKPVEVIKDIVPQLKLLRGFMGALPQTTKWAVDHDMTTEGERTQVIRAIGDALNAGEITDRVAAQSAVNSIYDGKPDALALKYFGKTLRTKLATDLPRYMGVPVSVWSEESKRSWEGQKLLYPENTVPPSPDVKKKLLDKYPGLEIIRGNIVPAGLNKDQEKRWKAAREYYAVVDVASQSRDQALADLQKSFDNPSVGATVTGAEYRERRKNLLQQFFGSIQTAKVRADQFNAPITSDQRDAFWQEVGRKIYPTHPLNDIVQDFYAIDSQDYIAPDGGMDWDAYFKARQDYMGSLSPSDRSWLESYLTDPSRPDADYMKAQKVAQKYWNVRNALIMQDPNLSTLLDYIEYYSSTNPDLASIFKKSPNYAMFNKTLEIVHRNMRKENPELDAVLQKYWGYANVWETQRQGKRWTPIT